MNTKPIIVDSAAVQFPQPTSLILSGKSGSGKTHFIRQYLNQTSHTFDRAIIIFREPDEFFTNHIPSQIPRTDLFHGEIPSDLYDMFNPKQRNLLIIEDMFTEAYESDEIRKVFTSGRHRNITCILTSQNLFASGKHARNVTLNAQYIVLFRMRDLNQISILSRQVYGEKNSTFLMRCYKDAMKNYGHLVVDLSTHHSIEEIRLRANVWGGKIICYNAH